MITIIPKIVLSIASNTLDAKIANNNNSNNTTNCNNTNTNINNDTGEK